MELKEAIGKFKNKRNELQEDVNRVEDYVNTLEDEEWIEAIDIVLEELDEKDQELYILKATIRDLKGQYKDYPFIVNVLKNLE